MRVHIPSTMQEYCGGQSVIDTAPVRNVKALISTLGEKYPELANALLEDDKLRPGVAVALDGVVQHLGALAPCSNATDVVFLPALSGG